jgi:hypothetical protein
MAKIFFTENSELKGLASTLHKFGYKHVGSDSVLGRDKSHYYTHSNGNELLIRGTDQPTIHVVDKNRKVLLKGFIDSNPSDHQRTKGYDSINNHLSKLHGSKSTK